MSHLEQTVESSYSSTIESNAATQRPFSFWAMGWERLKLNKPAIAALMFLAIILIFAIFLPSISQYTYYETHLEEKNLAPSFQHWFGTDELGRDIFVRIWWGARISLFVGITAALLDVLIGVFYGVTAGYLGGKTDEFMMRVADILYALPNLLIIILLMVILGSGIQTIILAMVITGWINMSRIIRSQILQIKEFEFVQAAKMMGGSPFWIIRKHLIPNVIGTMLTTLTFTIPTAIFTETFLSFLGLGIQAPIASWGTMANDGLYALKYYPWRLIIPASFICVTMLSFNLLGDALRDAFDPRLSK